MYFNLNVLPIKKIPHAGFTTTKQEKYCEISYPCFTGETEGQRLNNLSRRGKKVTYPNFQLWFFQPPPPPKLFCNHFGGALEQLPQRKYLQKLNLTPRFNKTYTLMFNKQDRKSLTSLNSSQNLKIGARAPVIIWTIGFIQDQETSEVLLCSENVRCHQGSVPKEQAKEQTGAYKKPKADPTLSAQKKENTYAHSCVCMHTRFITASTWLVFDAKQGTPSATDEVG